MAITRIILWLGNSCVLCAVLLAVTALSAFFMLDFSSAAKVAAIALTSGVMGATLIATTYNTPSQERNADALLFLLIFWCFIPLIGAMPYMMLGATDDYVSAYFEAVSAFTTTGASALVADDLPRTLLLWRSILQWFGGVSVATFAVVILAALNLAGTGIHRSALFTLKTGDLFTRLIGIGRIVMGIYGLLAGLCFITMVITGTDAFTAICLSLTALSTGGLAPETGPIAGYVGRVSALILGLFCVVGAMNISLIWDLLRLRRLRNVMSMLKNVEHRGLFVMAALLALFGLFYVGFNHAFTLVVESLYFVSTAGFDYNVIGIEMLPPVILIAIALMGGSALSTAGGVKIIRMLLLFRHLSTDMSRLSHPSRIVPVSFKSQHIPDRAFLSIWMYFFGYTLFFGVSILAIGATGLSFEDAVATGAASLSNMGPLLPATLPESGLTYADFTALQKGVSAIFMLIGRVEVLAVLILFTPSFWVR
jgi:trk system potassium uptake protein TrkH